MPEYMCLLYATAPVDEAAKAERALEMPLWLEITESLRTAGILKANGPLHPVDTATTVRVRDGRPQLTDGPFAATKEALVGYYVLECGDLDEASPRGTVPCRQVRIASRSVRSSRLSATA